MERVNWSKLSEELIHLYQSWKKLDTHGWKSGYPVPTPLAGGIESLLVTLVYENALEPLSELGFKPVQLEGEHIAFGHLNFRNLPAISQHEHTRMIKFSGPLKQALSTSVIAMRARDENSSLGAGLWHFENGDTPSLDGNYGQDVVIGVIDTGIEYDHEFFRELTGNGSRIMAIWDMTLTPQTGESSPDASLIPSTTSYGVEYTQSQIEAAIANTSGAIPIRHRDNNGHGTHVAGIAAGNGRPDFSHIGVAPGAKLIVVNYLPAQGNVTVGGSAVNNDILFRDALHYIRNKARKVDTSSPENDVPVVINCSLGSELGPHDGRDANGPPSQESYLRDFRLDGSNNEIPGSVVVFSSGNYSGKRRHLKVNLNGNLTIPFNLTDNRGTPNNNDLTIQAWYAHDPANPANVTVAVDTPDGGNTGAISLGNNTTLNYDAGNNKTINIFHSTRTANSPAYGSVSRNRITIRISPFNNNFLTGTGYNIRLTGVNGTEIHLWTEQSTRSVYPDYDLSGLSDNVVKAENRETCGSPGHSPDVITVANFDDTNDHLNYSSSRGPLVLYGFTPPAPQPPPGITSDFNKPNLAAPGTRIKSAGDGFVRRCRCCRKVNVAVNYTSKSGTSMSCPHVAGLVALMLKKNKTLTQSQVLKLLQDHATANTIRYLRDGTRENWEVTDASPLATVSEIGSGKVDAFDTVGAVPDPPTP